MSEVFKMWKDFKNFALKGNVVDLAIGVIIGGAFGKIVTSLVNDIFMPLLGFITAGTDFKSLKWIIKPATLTRPEVAVMYGSFIQNIIDFLIIAISVFFFLKLLYFRKKKQEAAKGPTEVELLSEIRDLLKQK
jgi:large conductance mechanosensitive channel